jgi:hypothetical protein
LRVRRRGPRPRGEHRRQNELFELGSKKLDQQTGIRAKILIADDAELHGAVVRED